MFKKRDDEDNATAENSKVGNDDDNDQSREEGRPVEREESQTENNVNDKDESYEEHSLETEINERIEVDQKSPHIMKISEKTKSQRDPDDENDRKTLTSMNEEETYSNSNTFENRHEYRRSLLTYSTIFSEEIVNSIDDEDKSDPKLSNQESNNYKEENLVQSDGNDREISSNPNEGFSNKSLERDHSVKSEEEHFNPNSKRKITSSKRHSNTENQSMSEEKVLVNTDQDVPSRKLQENLNGIGEESINPENVAFNRRLEQNTYESEKERFESNHKFDRFSRSEKFKTLNSNGGEENYNPKSSSAPRNTYIESEEEISVVNPYRRASDRHPGKNSNRKEENNTDLDISSSESGKGITIGLKERASRHNTDSIALTKKSYTKGRSKIMDDQSNHNLNEKEVENYAEADTLSSSKSFTLKENIRNEKEISENGDRGYNLNSKLSHNKFVNPNRERGSAVKFTDWYTSNDRIYDKRASGHHSSKDSGARTPIKSSSPEKIKMVDVVLRPSHEENTNLLTEVLKKTSKDKFNEPNRISSTPGQMKKEVIRINKELAPAVLLLLRKLEQSQNSGESASKITPIEMNTQGIKRQKSYQSLNDSGIEEEAKHCRNAKKDIPEEPNLVEREPKNHKRSVENLKHLNGNIQVKGTERTELVITKKSHRTTSTSTLEQFCSSSKCQRTCKRCSEVKKNIIQKEDSPNLRKGNSREDFDIMPTLEALAEKCKNGLKVGCSLLKNFYYNQDFVRFYYFQTHPGEGDLNEELEK